MDATFHKNNFKKLPKATSLVEQGHILKDWFIFRDSRHFGPLSSQQVRGFLSKKLLSENHFIWRPGFDGWVAIKEVEGFKSYGKNKIKICNDEEFSYKAKLSYVDRITQEARSLDFSEGSNPDRRKDFTENSYQTESQVVFSKFKYFFKTLFGYEGSNLNYGRFMGTILTLGVVCAMIYNAPATDYRQQLKSLPAAVQSEFNMITSKNLNVVDPNFSLFKVDKKVGEPIFVGAVNLPKGSRISFEVTGVQGTLVGAYRFFQKKEFSLKGRIFQTAPIRQANGKFIPPGKYKVEAYCLNCKEPGKRIYGKEYVLGVGNALEYKANLKTYAQSSRENVRLELDELEDLTYTMFNQYKSTSDRFMQSKSRKGNWQNFSATWLGRQNKLVDLFQQIKAPEFQESLYYLSLYEGYSKVVRQIFELHMMQDNLIGPENSVAKSAERLAPMVNKIDVNMKALKAQVELARVKFSQTDGIPTPQNITI